MHRDELIIRSYYRIGDQPQRNLNTSIVDPETGRPFEISERRLDRAVFDANELRSARAWADITAERDRRRQIVQKYFAELARDAIAQIEASEGWDTWISRLFEGVRKDGS